MPVVRTIPIADPGDLVGCLPGPEAVAWIHRGEGLVGWGETARVTLPAGEDRFTAGEKWLRALFDEARIDDQVGLPGSGPVAFGSFTFDPTSDGSVLVVPQTVIGRRSGRAWLTTIGDAPAPPGRSLPVTGPAVVRWHDGSLSAPQWERAVGAAVARIRAGDLRKVVLAPDLNATASVSVDAVLSAESSGAVRVSHCSGMPREMTIDPTIMATVLHARRSRSDWSPSSRLAIRTTTAVICAHMPLHRGLRA